MKRIITFLLLFAALKVAGQTTGYLRFDTVRIMKQSGTCELYIINKTKDSMGLLTNIGGGLTQFKRSRMLNDSTLIIGLDTLTVHGTGGGGAGSVASLSQGFGIIHTPNPIISTGTIKADTSKLATVTSLRDSLAAHPTLIVDTVRYVHSGAEVDTLTKTALIGKTIIFAGVHPFALWIQSTYPPATDEVYVNTVTGGIKFGTPLQTGQTVTIIYKYLLTTGVPTVQSVAVNGGTAQTGTVSLTIPAAAITQLTGDGSAGPGSGSQTLTLASVVSAGSCTNCNVTFDAKGRATTYATGSGGSGSGASLVQVDSAIKRLAGKSNVKLMHLILRPTWSGSATTWDILGNADAHDSLYAGGLTLSVVGGQLRVNYPSADYVAGLQANWDDVMQKNLYAIGGSAGLTFTQFTIWKNFHQKDVWLGSDLLDGSFDNSVGNAYRVKCDTSTGIFTAEWNLSTSDTLYTTLVEAGNYNSTFPQVHVIQVRRTTTTSMEFYLVDGLTGLRRKGVLTTDDNFFISVTGRKAVNADTENFGSNAAIFIDGAMVDNP
jgi:hypothetical protein